MEQKWIRYIFQCDWDSGDWLEFIYPTREEIETAAKADEEDSPIIKIEITAVTLDLET